MLVNSAVFRYDLKEALGSDWKQECSEVIESLNEQRNSPVHTFLNCVHFPAVPYKTTTLNHLVHLRMGTLTANAFSVSIWKSTLC